MSQKNPRVYQGDTFVIKRHVKNLAGEVLNLADLTEATFTARRSPTAGEIKLSKTLADGIAVVDAEAGILTVSSAYGDTSDLLGQYTWDIKLHLSGDEHVYTVEGYMTVLRSV